MPSFSNSFQMAGGLPSHYKVRLNGYRGLSGRCAWLGITSRTCPRPKPTTPTLLNLLNLLTSLTSLNPLTLINPSLDHRRHYSSSYITSSFIVASPLYTYCVTLHKDGIGNVEQSGVFPPASILNSLSWNILLLVLVQLRKYRSQRHYNALSDHQSLRGFGGNCRSRKRWEELFIRLTAFFWQLCFNC